MPIYRCANWRPIVNNVGGWMDSTLGVLMHQQVGYGSLFGFFNNPISQVSAHFWVSQSGTIEQYVDTTRVAWHAMQLNGSYCGIEFEGMPDDPLTAEQISAGGKILAEGHTADRWPLVLCNAAGQRGFGYHRMPGGVATACPSELRLSARQACLDAALGVSIPPTVPPYINQNIGVNLILQDPVSYGNWCIGDDGHIEANSGAPFLGALFPNRYDWQAIGKIAGIALLGDPTSKDVGYQIAVQRFSPTPDGHWFAIWGFPRDGSNVTG